MFVMPVAMHTPDHGHLAGKSATMNYTQISANPVGSQPQAKGAHSIIDVYIQGIHFEPGKAYSTNEILLLKENENERQMVAGTH